jgi:hypothetical protein
MLLVRLLLLAASGSVASVVASIPKESLLRFGRLGGNAPAASASAEDPSKDDRFHNRNSDVPDVQGQTYETTAKCIREQEALARELDELIADTAKLDKDCETGLSHYKDMNVVTERQINRLKTIVADRKDESDLPPFYRARYTSIMCAKFHDGFVTHNERARLEVYAICDGNKSLTDCRLRSAEDVIWSHSRLYEVSTVAVDPSSAKLRASPECFQAQAVQDQVNSTRKARNDKEQKCKNEEAKLRKDLNKKREVEDDLWTEYYGHVSQKGSIKKEEAWRVATRFCPIVRTYRQGGPACTRDRDRMMEDFYRAKCLP